MSLERCLLKHRDVFNAQMQKADMLAAKERYMKEGMSAHDASVKAVQDKINALEKSKAALAKGDAVEGMLDRLATRGSNGAEVMDLLAATHPSPYVRALAKHLRKYVADTKFRFGTPAEEAKVLNQTKREGIKAANIAGSYTAVLDTVRLYKPDRLLDTVLHEFVHAASVHALNRAEAFGTAGAAKDLRQLFAAVKETASAEELKLYGFHNAKEFVAEAFVDPDLRDFLKSQPYDTAANMWEAFKNFVAKLLGLPRDTRTLFDRVMELSADIFEENISAKAEYTALRDEPAKVESDAFKKWFGDSKVVDSNGKPLVVYHGTKNGAGITEFAPMFDTLGTHFGSRAQAAAISDAFTIPAYLSIKNPLRMTDPGTALWATDRVGNELVKNGILTQAEFEDSKQYEPDDRGDAFMYAIERAGFDGIVYANTKEGDGDSFIAFRPEQIKSAIGNSGKYDATKGDISAKPSAVVDEGDSDTRPVMNATVSQAIGNNPQFIDSLGKLRRGKMYMQFLRDLKDNYGDLLKDANGQPILKKYVDTAFEMGATANELLKSGGDIAERWNELREVKAKVNAIAAEATMAGVHPDIPLTMQDYPSNGRTISNKHLADAKGEFPAEVQEIHARLSNIWKTELNDKGRKVYVDARDHMAKSWDKRRRLLNKRVFDMYEPLIAEALKAGNAGKAREWIRERNAFVREHGKVLAQVKGPYFPLSRFGDYYVVYKSDAYKKLEAEVNAASDALRELYVKYDISAEDKATIDQLAGAGVDVQVLTPETKEAVKAAKDRVEKARAELDEMASNGKEYANEAFEAESAATARAKELGVDVMLKKDYYRQLSPVTEAFLNRIGDAVGGALPEKQANAAREAIVQIWLQSLPDTSAMRSELRRRRVAGFSTDMLRSFSKNAQTNAHYLSRLEHIDDLTSELMAMETASKQPGVPLQGKELYNEMARRHVESLQYSDNPLANALSGVAFVWQLGVSPAFLLTNLSQPWMISMPFMSGRHGVYRSTAELGRAFKDTAAAVSSGIKSGDSKLFFEIDKTLFTKEEQTMLASAQKDGLLDITLEYDLSAMSKGEQSKLSRATRAISAVPHQVEVINRVMTALAAYRMEVKKTGDADGATEYVKRVLDKTHIDYSATNAPSFLKPGFMGGFGKVVFQYRKYQLGMLSLLANQMKSALKGNPEAKRALLGLFLMHGTMAGSVGLPLMGSAMFVANLVQNAFGDDDTPWDADVEFRNWLADVFGVEADAVIAKGVPMLAGIDLSSRVGMSDIGAPIRVLRDNKKGRELWLEVLASGMGPTLGGLAPQMVEAVSLMGSGEMLKGAEKAVPRALADPIKAYRTSSEGVTTGKGVVAVSADRVDTWDTALQALGIPPSILSERAAAVAAVEDAKGELKERRGQLERAYVDARVKGDQDGMAEAQAAVAKFNEAQRAKGLPVIKPGDLLTAFKNRKEGEKKMTTQGFTLDKKNKAVGEYGRFADVR